MSQHQPLCILVAALGGEGGGVLAEWLVNCATQAGYPVQATSVPGVAQRTGATSYYVEVYPRPRRELGAFEPVLGLNPVPGKVDVVLASELLEAARVMLNGFVSPDRTLVITSSQRTLTTAEKMQMGDGRQESERLLAALRRFSQRLVSFDMTEAARSTDTVLSAVMLGALAGMNVLPIEREIFEQVIGIGERGAAASKRGFARGLVEVLVEAKPHERERVSRQVHGMIADRFPLGTHAIISEGYARLVDYQDIRYAALYLPRIERILAFDSSEPYAMTNEFARFLALWMTYEDVPRVADLKTRGVRFARVRREVGAEAADLVRIVDYFKPTIIEFCALLPEWIAKPVLAWHRRRVARGKAPLAWALHVRSDGIAGMLMLRVMAWLKHFRRNGARYTEEQALIERWTNAITSVKDNPSLAFELIVCGRLIKGYGDTHARGT